MQGEAHELGELGPGVFEVAALIAGELAPDAEGAVAREEARGEGAQALFGRKRERSRGVEVEEKLDTGGDLVDVLAARPLGADGTKRKIYSRDHQAFTNDESFHGGYLRYRCATD